MIRLFPEGAVVVQVYRLYPISNLPLRKLHFNWNNQPGVYRNIYIISLVLNNKENYKLAWGIGVGVPAKGSEGMFLAAIKGRIIALLVKTANLFG